MSTQRLCATNLARTSLSCASGVLANRQSPNFALTMWNTVSTFDRLWYLVRNSSRRYSNMCHIRAHADPSTGLTLLDLNGMKGTAPRDSISAALFLVRYPLSAETSSRVKFLAVRFANSGRCWASFDVAPVT